MQDSIQGLRILRRIRFERDEAVQDDLTATSSQVQLGVLVEGVVRFSQRLKANDFVADELSRCRLRCIVSSLRQLLLRLTFASLGLCLRLIERFRRNLLCTALQTVLA